MFSVIGGELCGLECAMGSVLAKVAALSQLIGRFGVKVLEAPNSPFQK